MRFARAPRADLLRTLAPPLCWSLLLLSCMASRHATQPAALGTPARSESWVRQLAEPGPIGFEKVVAADWVVARSGLVNLDHPAAQQAGLEDGDEPIQIYFYVLRHPTRGRFLVDSGLEAGFRDPEGNPRVGFLVRQAMNTEALDVHVTTGDWLARSGGSLDGVFLTHIHLDHIMGVPDLPADTPVYTGPGETDASLFLNLFSRGTTDRLLAGAGPLREWQFAPDPAGRFEGVLDVFGDGTVFALHVPGHTPGSTAFAVRTPEGPRLLVGDASHTRWGWENGVEPGTFSLDGPRSAESLARLRRLADDVPGIEVHLGHQPASQGAKLGRRHPAR